MIPTVPPPKVIPPGTSDYIAESIRQTRRARDELNEIMRDVAIRRSVTAGLAQDPQSRLLRKVEAEKERRRLGFPDPYEVRRYRHSTRSRMKGSDVEFDRSISRREIIDRDESTCYICGKVCLDTEINLDHVVPISKGGPHTVENLRVACIDCNMRKGSLSLEVYLAKRKRDASIHLRPDTPRGSDSAGVVNV